MSIVQWTMSTVKCKMPIVQCKMSIVQCKMPVVQCTLSFVQCKMSIVQCTLSIVHCSIPIVQCTMSTVQYTMSIVYILHCTIPKMAIVQCKMSIVEYEMSTVQCMIPLYNGHHINVKWPLYNVLCLLYTVWFLDSVLLSCESRVKVQRNQASQVPPLPGFLDQGFPIPLASKNQQVLMLMSTWSQLLTGGGNCFLWLKQDRREGLCVLVWTLHETTPLHIWGGASSNFLTFLFSSSRIPPQANHFQQT